MTALPAFAMQLAVVESLKSDTTLNVLLGADRVYDAVPSRAAYPYIAYGPITIRDWSTGANFGHEHILSLTIYSRSPGFKEIYELSNAVCSTLQNNSISIANHKLVIFRFEAAEFTREPDPLTSRALLTFRALTEQV